MTDPNSLKWNMLNIEDYQDLIRELEAERDRLAAENYSLRTCQVSQTTDLVRMRELIAERDQLAAEIVRLHADIGKLEDEKDRYRKALEFITASPVVDSRDIAYKIASGALRGE